MPAGARFRSIPRSLGERARGDAAEDHAGPSRSAARRERRRGRAGGCSGAQANRALGRERSTSPRSRSARSPTRRSAPPISWPASIPISPTPSSRSRSASSTSASPPTRLRPGSARSRSACSATTARSTPWPATSTGCARASTTSAPRTTPRSTRRSRTPAPTRARSTTRSSCSCAAAATIRHALAMLIPEAWEEAVELDEELRDFYRYHSCLIEPWDGPAGIIFTRRARSSVPGSTGTACARFATSPPRTGSWSALRRWDSSIFPRA